MQASLSTLIHRVLSVLSRHPAGLGMHQLRTLAFHRHLPSLHLQRILHDLQRQGQVALTIVPTGHRPRHVWRLLPAAPGAPSNRPTFRRFGFRPLAVIPLLPLESPH